MPLYARQSKNRGREMKSDYPLRQAQIAADPAERAVHNDQGSHHSVVCSEKTHRSPASNGGGGGGGDGHEQPTRRGGFYDDDFSEES